MKSSFQCSWTEYEQPQINCQIRITCSPRLQTSNSTPSQVRSTVSPLSPTLKFFCHWILHLKPLNHCSRRQGPGRLKGGESISRRVNSNGKLFLGNFS